MITKAMELKEYTVTLNDLKLLTPSPIENCACWSGFVFYKYPLRMLNIVGIKTLVKNTRKNSVCLA